MACAPSRLEGRHSVGPDQVDQSARIRVATGEPEGRLGTQSPVRLGDASGIVGGTGRRASRRADDTTHRAENIAGEVGDGANGELELLEWRPDRTVNVGVLFASPASGRIIIPLSIFTLPRPLWSSEFGSGKHETKDGATLTSGVWGTEAGRYEGGQTGRR